MRVQNDGVVSDDSQTAVSARGGLLEALADGVCHRAFSSPEAFLYELTIARALAKVVEPQVKERLRGVRCLDVGSGGGRIALGVAQSGHHHVVGVDPSRAQVRRFARRGRTSERASVLLARAEDLPFSDNAFDSLYSSCTWKHWPDPAHGISECVRVTRTGGPIVIIEIDGASDEETFKRFAYTSQVPVGLRKAYVRFALRTVVGVAPESAALAESFAGMPIDDLTISRLDDMPFLIAQATAGQSACP
jgi:ubiquinone/menaquinone biosynthesis C-methylase UbiE